MTREELIEKIQGVKSVTKDRNIIYEVLTELGVPFKKSNCIKCLKDLKNIALEELGMIESAAEVSSFDGTPNEEYEYLRKRAVVWRGKLINQDTPVEIVREFVKRFPNGYYRKAERPAVEQETEDTENNTNNQE